MLRNIAITALLLLASSRLSAFDFIAKPRFQETLQGGSPANAVARVENPRAKLSPAGTALWTKAMAKAPKAGLGSEGYVLQTSADGALILAATSLGALRAQQTLRQLPVTKGQRPSLWIVDYPNQAWRGLHVLDSGAASLPDLKRLIKEVMVPTKANILIYEIDYDFKFKSHPEIKGMDPFSKEQIRDLVATAKAEGIKVIPEIQLFGHQSWGSDPPGALLAAHPHLEEPPDSGNPQTTFRGPDFYCRSWCPRHPDLHPIVFKLIDEVVDAFQTDMFHVGMDEVFVIASKKCPRCAGKDPAELFADQVNMLHGHLKKKGVTMLMWADRLLDGKATGYGKWEGSFDGTAPALNYIPKDIILCDWHYEGGVNGQFPSLDIFLKRGFRVWPTVFKSEKDSYKFMDEANKRQNPKMLGTMASVWFPAGEMTKALMENRGDKLPIAKTAVQVLKKAWSGN